MNTPAVGFGVSAYLAHLYSPAPAAELRTEITKLCSYMGVTDNSLIEFLVQQPLFVKDLNEIRLRNVETAPHPSADRQGRAAKDYFACQLMATTLLGRTGLDQSATYHSSIRPILERGADGLLVVGFLQFERLALIVARIANWLGKQSFKKIVIVESPSGNSVPCQLLERVLMQRCLPASIEVWNAPRNEDANIGGNVDDSAEQFLRQAAGADLFLYMDDAASGSRMTKLYNALYDHCGKERVLGFAMVFGGPGYHPTSTQHSQLRRLKKRLDRQSAFFGLKEYHNEFPPIPLYKIDDGALGMWGSRVIWGDVDLLAGKRKVNLVFAIIDHYMMLIEDLTAPESKYRHLVEMAFIQDTTGTIYLLAPGVLQSTFAAIYAGLGLDEFAQRFRLSAREAFPNDYVGRVSSDLLTPEGFGRRMEWLRNIFINEVTQRCGNQEAWVLWKALDAAFAASMQMPVPMRDSDYAQYTIPFNPALCTINQRIMEWLVNRVNTVNPQLL